MNKKYTLSLLSAVLLGVGVVSTAFVFAEQARTESAQLFGEENASVLYSELDKTRKNVKLKSLNFGIFRNTETLKEEEGFVNQKVFVSPDRKYLAITTELAVGHEVSTYITDLEGNVIVPSRLGSFKSWSSDSEKVLLYLSVETTGKTRQIFFLDVYGNYYNSDLPDGVINADVSEKDGSIVYSVTEQGTDKSDIYVRNNQGNDQLVIKGEDNIFSWVRWSPDGNKITFMKSDLLLRPKNQTVWVMDIHEDSIEKISYISWGYFPVWSPSGNKIAFSNGVNIMEYDVINKDLKQITDFTDKGVKHPSYSEDGQTIVFSDGQQIWSVRDEIVTQLTEGDLPKDYPVLD